MTDTDISKDLYYYSTKENNMNQETLHTNTKINLPPGIKMLHQENQIFSHPLI